MSRTIYLLLPLNIRKSIWNRGWYIYLCDSPLTSTNHPTDMIRGTDKLSKVKIINRRQEKVYFHFSISNSTPRSTFCKRTKIHSIINLYPHNYYLCQRWSCSSFQSHIATFVVSKEIRNPIKFSMKLNLSPDLNDWWEQDLANFNITRRA